jgi:hypothetical protein
MKKSTQAKLKSSLLAAAIALSATVGTVTETTA